MDDRIRDLFQELELYIREHWVDPARNVAQEDEELDLAAEVEEDEELNLPADVEKDERLDPAADIREAEDLDLPEDVKEKECPGSNGDADSKGSSRTESAAVSLDDLLGDMGKTFHEVLFEKIVRSGMTDVEVYRRANMDRKLFSKIRSNPAYHPRKDTILALAVALKLNLEETQDLLSRAEYALSPSSKSDVIIRYFIERGVYDLHLINIALDDHGLEILE